MCGCRRAGGRSSFVQRMKPKRCACEELAKKKRTVPSQHEKIRHHVLHAAREHFETGDYCGALAACQDLIPTLSGSELAEAWLLTGAARLELGETWRCVEATVRSLEAGGGAEALCNLGVGLSTIDLELARECTIRAVEATPRMKGAYENLAGCETLRGETFGALEALLTAALVDGSQVCGLGDLYQRAGFTNEAKWWQSDAARRGLQGAKPWAALGAMAREDGDVGRAAGYYREAIQVAKHDEDRAALWAELGNVIKETGRVEESARCYEEAVRLAPNHASALGNLAACWLELGRIEAAINMFERAVRAHPKLADAWNNLGNALRKAKRVAEATRSYRHALSLRPDHAHAWNNLGNSLRDAGECQKAVACYERATRLAPRLAAAQSNLGLVLKERGDVEGALSRFQTAISVDPSFADAYSNLGNLLKDAGRVLEAVECYAAAIRLRPDFVDAYANLAAAYKDAGRHAEACACYRKALSLKPDLHDTLANLAHALISICDWSSPEADLEALRRVVLAQLDVSPEACPSVQPFHALVYPNFTPGDLRRISARYAKRAQRVALALAPWRPPLWRTLPPDEAARTVGTRCRPRDNRLRVGYVSSDFGDHPLSHLMRSVFGLHDRSKFEVACYALSPDDGSVWRRRITADAERFVDCSRLDLPSLAATVRADEVDILFNLNGYTKGARTELFALEAAPVQVSYLGFCGTLAADYVPWLVADNTVAPPETRDADFTENIVALPNSYFVTDHAQSAAFVWTDDDQPTRSDLGLPNDAFVYCNFNQLYKIDDVTLDAWCRILAEAGDDAVLWLLRFPPAGEAHVRAFAAGQKIPSCRIVFTDVAPKPAHLKRARLADLFLDTPHCNAHTTACDVLWAGCPILTLPTAKMAGRVAASLLAAAADHPDYASLIATDLDHYLQIALHLKRDKQAYAAIRAILQRPAGHTLARTPMFGSRSPACRPAQCSHPPANTRTGSRLTAAAQVGSRLRDDASLLAPLWDTTTWVRDFESAIHAIWTHRHCPTHLTLTVPEQYKR